jgi:hypothetical protein
MPHTDGTKLTRLQPIWRASALRVMLDKSCGDLIMIPFSTPDADLEQRLAGRLLDVLIRATVLLAVALLCYRVLAPFAAPVML